MKTAIAFIIGCLFLVSYSSAMAAGSCVRGDCHNGHGVYKWASGNQYTGTFQNGCRDGKGIFTFANGDRYSLTQTVDRISEQSMSNLRKAGLK
jgi:hypothetical protein